MLMPRGSRALLWCACLAAAQKPSPMPTAQPTDTDDKCVCCFFGAATTVCAGSTACYCCCGDGDDDGAVESFDRCVKRCEKENDGFICGQDDDDWLTTSRKSSLESSGVGLCDGATPRGHRALVVAAAVIAAALLCVSQ
ncbi:hypothetical protein M885DRAFT_515073 [Pelagophyceae sp. CCMP2097]|nr:hypothetical protein M885DRAFT_515073 [Pelagophyceae sp. CCMP2097]